MVDALIDLVCAGNEHSGIDQSRRAYEKQIRTPVLPHRFTAKRFFVSEAASKLVSNLLPRLDDMDGFSESLAEYALPPFPVSYMEFMVPMEYEDGHMTPTRMGVLTTEPLWYFFADIPGDQGGWDARMLTVQWNRETQNWQGRINDGPDDFDKAMRTMLNTIRLLFLLMAKRAARYVDVPASRRIVRGKVKACAARTEVHIELSDVEDLRFRFPPTGERAGVRHHSVRGHYVHKPSKVSCPLENHNYQRITNKDPHDPTKRWECMCGAKRTWRTYPNGRGDATLGHVTPTYVVERDRKVT